jgi:hypothetical protein
MTHSLYNFLPKPFATLPTFTKKMHILSIASVLLLSASVPGALAWNAYLDTKCSGDSIAHASKAYGGGTCFHLSQYAKSLSPDPRPPN